MTLNVDDDHAQKPPFHATIITVFPEMFPGILG
jgi:hypothetical protein